MTPKRGLDPNEIEAAREELRARLPELKKLPGFPKGDDEDILKMSIPPYYTACPNPFIEEWLKETAPEGYDSEPYEDPGPFTADISEGKGHLIYKAHSYPTKVPHQAIMRYILHYTRPGDVVLDGFCGTGMTGVAAQACGNPELEFKHTIETKMGKVRWGARRAILQDLSPSATFIAAGLNLPIDAEAFDKRSQEILDEFQEEWGWMYETTHTDGTKAKIDYTVWSEVFTCPHCGGEVVFYDVAFNEKTGRVNESFLCSSCGAGLNKNILAQRFVKVTLLDGSTIDRIEFRPVRIVYRLGKRTHTKQPDDADHQVLRKVRSASIGWFPTDQLPLDDMYHGSRLKPKGFTSVHHLWPDRALAGLAILWNKCTHEEDPAVRTALLFWAEQALWGLSWMNRHKVIQFGRVGGSLVNQYMTGVYYVPSLSAECSVRYNLEGSSPAVGKRRNLVKMWAHSPSSGLAPIATASSERLELPDQSVDYIFVDPPFGANIPYADLGIVIEAWHGVVSNPEREAIIDKARRKGLPEYQDLMEACFREFFRVLKPGRWMTVEFNNSKNEVWLAIQEALSSARFVVADTRVFDKEHLSYRQVTAKNAVKRDLIISAYRPADEAEERFSVVAGTEEGAWEFVKEHLRHLPVFEGTNQEARPVRERQGDRLYDRMVAYHIHRGASVPMTAGEFYAGLEERFPLRDNMYFLPEQVGEYESKRAVVEEFGQIDLFITNEASALQWLRQFLRDKPRAFAEIQPPFFTELQEGLPDWEDLPDLKVLLDQNFLRDDKDRWYVPDPKNAADLEKVRDKALLKEFEAYISKKGKLTKFRSEAVRAGFREAWRRRDFHEIVQVGDRLPEEVFAEDESLLYYLDNARQRLEV